MRTGSSSLNFFQAVFTRVVMTSFLFLDNIEKIKKKISQVLNIFENIMGNGAFNKI